jgi:phage FluMu protein Com
MEWQESNKTFADEECQAFESVKWMRGVLSSSAVLVMLRGCSETDFPLGCICAIDTAKYILGDDGVYDLLRVANYPVLHEGETISTSTSTLRIIPEIGSLGHHLKDFDNQVDLLSYAIGRERFLSVMTTETDSHVSESAEGFVPTWRDRRMPIHINKAQGSRYLFHDLIRCSECNGRVILMLQVGHGYSAVECPHCKEADGIKCSHLKIKEGEKT